MSTMMLNNSYATYMMHVFQSMFSTCLQRFFIQPISRVAKLEMTPQRTATPSKKPADTSWDENE